MKYIYLILLLALISCNNAKIVSEAQSKVENAVLIYMAAENSLSSKSTSDITEITQFVSETSLDNFRVLIYRDYYGSDPYLFEISKNTYGGLTFNTLKTYPDQDSSTPEVLTEVLNDFFDNVEADNYKLDLWSHGSGWEVSASTTITKAILNDGSNFMNISDLKATLPDGVFDCILFDACLMGNIEVAYALKDKTNYIVASPSEVPGDGMPYHLILESFLSGDYAETSNQYFEYYNNTTYSSCGISGVYKMSEIDKLRDSFKDIISDNISSINSLTASSIQQFSPYYSYELYDLYDYISHLESDTTKLANFESALNDFVVYKKYKNDDDASGKGLQSIGWGVNYYTVSVFSGVSCYIPFTSSSRYDDYVETDWYVDTYGAN